MHVNTSYINIPHDIIRSTLTIHWHGDFERVLEEDVHLIVNIEKTLKIEYPSPAWAIGGPSR